MFAQQGAYLMEIALVVGILALLAVYALPDLSQSMAQARMEQASRTVQQSLQRARLTARNHNTWVTIRFQADRLALNEANTPQQTESIMLPADIQVINGPTLRFSPDGVLEGNEQSILRNREIRLHTDNTGVGDTVIQISRHGRIATTGLAGL